jgi:hypothetical protein
MMRWKWPYITRSGNFPNQNQAIDFAEEAFIFADDSFTVLLTYRLNQSDAALFHVACI